MKAWLIDDAETPVSPLERKVEDEIFGVDGEEMQLEGEEEGEMKLESEVQKKEDEEKIVTGE